MAWRLGPAGVGEQGTFTEAPRDPGRPRHLLGKPRREHRVTNSRPAAGAPGGRGSEPRVRPGYRQAKATKCGGTGGWESERRVVPGKRGNRPEGPRGGKEAPGHETAGGTDARDSEPCYHLNTTTADSVTGPWPRGHGRIHGLKSRVPELGMPGFARHNASFVTGPWASTWVKMAGRSGPRHGKNVRPTVLPFDKSSHIQISVSSMCTPHRRSALAGR
ncbi:MAG: hypothetical protein QOE80_2872 [Actinomycetota bacterium]|nr:hypothetical protein [Actinomycetota bacterium]